MTGRRGFRPGFYGDSGYAAPWNKSAASAWNTVDGFEDDTEPSSEWTVSNGSASANSSTVLNGSQSLETSGTTALQMRSTSGFSTYVGKGNRFRVAVRATTTSSTTRGALRYGVGGSSSMYEVWLDYDDGQFEFRKRDGGAPSLIANVDFSPSADTWYWIEAEWDDGTGSNSDNDHSHWVYTSGNDRSSAKASLGTNNDTTHDGSDGYGVYGVAGSSSDSVFFDSYQYQGI